MYREFSYAHFERKRQLIVPSVSNENQDEKLVYSPGYKPTSEFGGSHPYVLRHTDGTSQTRSLIWRVRDAVLELQEVAIGDCILDHNSLLLKFPAQIIPNVCIYEDLDSKQKALYIFVATRAKSVHRIVIKPTLPMQRNAENVSLLLILSNNFKQRHSGVVVSKNAPIQVMTCIDENTVALGCANGDTVCIQFTQQGSIEYELSDSSLMGLPLLSFFKKSSSENGVVAIECIEYKDERFLITLCSDMKIRIWSLEKKKQVVEYFIFDNEEKMNISFNFCPMRLVNANEENIFYLVVCITEGGEPPSNSLYCVRGEFIESSKDLIVKLKPDGIKYTPNKIIDFVIERGNVWVLSSLDEYSYNISYGPLLRGAVVPPGLDSMSPWMTVQSLYADISAFPDECTITKDLQDVLLDRVFAPWSFGKNVVAKVVSADPNLSVQELKEAVLLAISKDFDNRVGKVSQDELTEQDYERFMYMTWKQFWRACTKVWASRHQPLSFCFLTQDLTTLGVLNQLGITLLRPCDAIETVYCNPALPYADRSGFLQFVGTKDIPSLLRDDVLLLVDCISYLANQIGETFLAMFERSLFYCEEPLAAAHPYITWILGGVSDIPVPETQQQQSRKFMIEFVKRWKKIRQPQKAVELLLVLLEKPAYFTTEENEEMDESIELPRIKSDGARIITSTTLQMLNTRFKFSRDFSLLLFLLSQLRSKIGMQLSFRTKNETLFIYKISTILKMYHNLLWVSKQFLEAPTTFIETNKLLFSKLQISEKKPPVSITQDETFLQLFFEKHMMRYQISLEQIPKQSPFFTSVSHIHLYLSLKTLEFLWCVDDDQKVRAVDIAKLLYDNEQYHILEEFVRLMIQDITHLNHFLGLCYLNKGQAYKAKDCFVQAAVAIANQSKQALTKKIFETFDLNLSETGSKNPVFHYYNCIRQLCEKHPDLVLTFSHLAIQEAHEDQKEEMSILWSVIFDCNLAFERYDDAYVAITSNSDTLNRRKADLRRFLSVLCEKGKLSFLNELPYVEMVNDVDDILQQKARTSDIMQQPNYYEILYAFHIFRGNYNKAAQIMYQFGKRLEKESSPQELERQGNCFLSAINALSLVSKENRWILFIDEDEQGRPSKKRKVEEERQFLHELTQQPNKDKKLPTIVTVEDIRKAYLMTKACIQLSKTSSLKATPSLKPNDAVILLVEAGFYDTALSLCVAFNLDKKVVFENLTSKCVRLQLLQTEETPFTIEEEISTYVGRNGKFKSREADSHGWNLLEYYLDKYDSLETNYQYHDIVLNKIFSIDKRVRPPNWFIMSLKEVNPSALLRNYLKYELYDEATLLVIEYLSWKIAMKQSQHISGQFSATASIPFTLIDNLVSRLKDKPNVELKDKLNQTLQNYFALVVNGQ